MGTIVVAARGALELLARGWPDRYPAEAVKWLWLKRQPRGRHQFKRAYLPGLPKSQQSESASQTEGRFPSR
ncbi:MAG: hypothetical protein CBARDCOR_0376 [uncultured Caballeronia sp.]|nr:MAG: hypothetical protein CBARDCOR_0376 [uncultured Caballeronia sp.]